MSGVRPACAKVLVPALGLALLAGCATTPGDPLAALHPYVWLEDGRVDLLTCRWTRGPIPTWVDRAASAGERAIVERALGSWAGAGLGISFSPVPEDEAALRVRFNDEPLVRDNGKPGAGLTVADCARGDGAGEGTRLVSADVRLARNMPDALGRPKPVSDAQLAGTALHELGHALGFQGHARHGRGVMNAASDTVRFVGARLLRGPVAPDPGVVALYARRSGSVVHSQPVTPWRSAWVDHLATLAQMAPWRGPYLRVGDVRARIYFVDPEGREIGAFVANLKETLADPASVLVVPEEAAREYGPTP